MNPALSALFLAVQRLYRLAFALSLFTIVYNVAEGLLSVYFGWKDGTLALFGFGVDSFIDVVSGPGPAGGVGAVTHAGAVHFALHQFGGSQLFQVLRHGALGDGQRQHQNAAPGRRFAAGPAAARWPPAPGAPAPWQQRQGLVQQR